MPQTCKTCSHPQRAEIEKLMVGKLGNTQISLKFQVSASSLRYHKNNHLQAIIQEAEAEAKQQIVDLIKDYRAEVHYAPISKVKMAQERILGEIEMSADIGARIGLYREFRGLMQEEFKLGGHYQKERENENDAIARRLFAVLVDQKQHLCMCGNYEPEWVERTGYTEDTAKDPIEPCQCAAFRPAFPNWSAADQEKDIRKRPEKLAIFADFLAKGIH